MLRPKEIRGLLVSDISIAKGQITVRKDVAKNGKERIVPMTTDLIEDFVKLNLQDYPQNNYVFGANLAPAKTKLANDYMHKYWAKMRIKLGLPEEMQQYSLRDSGIFEMLKSGIDPLSVQQLADHHSLEMTAIYAKHRICKKSLLIMHLSLRGQNYNFTPIHSSSPIFAAISSNCVIEESRYVFL